jgi:hypothetical protein
MIAAVTVVCVISGEEYRHAIMASFNGQPETVGGLCGRCGPPNGSASEQIRLATQASIAGATLSSDDGTTVRLR